MDVPSFFPVDKPSLLSRRAEYAHQHEPQLIHDVPDPWPILAWVLKPVIGTWYRIGMGSIPLLLSSFVFVLLIYMLAMAISTLIIKIAPVSVRTLPAKPDSKYPPFPNLSPPPAASLSSQ